MKPILLLYPPFEGKNYLHSRTPFPIGLLYIASYLESKGMETKVMDFSYPQEKRKTLRPPELMTGQATFFRFGWPDSDILDWLRENGPKYHKIIGISSLMSSNWSGGYRLIQLVKMALPDSTVVIGGPHVTCSPNHVFEKSRADYICLGEGEATFHEFLRTGKAEGIIHRTEMPVKRERTCFIEDMDSLPFLNKELLLNYHPLKEVYITFSRGCPHHCSFCCNYLLQGRKWRNKSVERCIAEIKHFNQSWGVKRFIVEDDNLSPTKIGINHIKELCKRIIEEGFKFYFHVSHGIPVYATSDSELCELLWQAGFRGMVFPLESVDRAVLKDMNKGFTLDHYEKAIKNWKWEKNYATETIIGYPFVETIRTMLETMLFIHRNGALVWASHFRLNYGTPLYQRCLEAGYVSKSFDPINQQSFFIKTERFSIKDLQELMQIGRGLNYLVEYGGALDKPPFDNWALPGKVGDVIATGKFNFNRSQAIAAGILLTKTGKFVGRPMVSVVNGEQLVYKGQKASKVYKVLQELLGATYRGSFFDKRS